MLTMTKPIPFLHTTRCERSAERVKAELRAHRIELAMRIIKLLSKLALGAAIWLTVVWLLTVVMTFAVNCVFAVLGSGFIGQVVGGLVIGGIGIAFVKLTTPSRY